MPDPRILPVFPLSTVLVPGLVMPLHIFEQRYRDLVADLSDLPEDQREFVIIAIRDGQEVGTDGVRALFDVGTIATIREISPHEDGRFDLVTVGTTRVRMGTLLEDRSYYQAEVTELPEEAGDDAEILLPQVASAFATYRSLLTSSVESTDDLPDDPGVLSYLIAAAVVLDLPDRQHLLEIPDDGERLRVELRRLRYEINLMQVIPSLPAVEFPSALPSAN